MTARLLIDACGLSQREAAEFLGVRIDTVKSWHRINPPQARPGVLAELRALHAIQRRAAAHLIVQVRETTRAYGEAEMVEIGLSTDDHEARSLGWPCVGAHRMAIALAAARLTGMQIVLVPRGSTIATAIAADAHDG